MPQFDLSAFIVQVFWLSFLFTCIYFAHIFVLKFLKELPKIILSFSLLALVLIYISLTASCEILQDIAQLGSVDEKFALYRSLIEKAWFAAAVPFLKQHPEMQGSLSVCNTSIACVIELQNFVTQGAQEYYANPQSFNLKAWLDMFAIEINKIRGDFVDAPGLSYPEKLDRQKLYPLIIAFSLECLQTLHPKFGWVVLPFIHLSKLGIVFV